MSKYGEPPRITYCCGCSKPQERCTCSSSTYKDKKTGDIKIKR
jgi:hypothetical protein